MGMRAFIIYLHQRRCFSNHPYSKAKLRRFPGHTINTYMRSIRAFWSWLAEEEIIESNPFSKLKIPKPPKKIITAFSQHQIDLLLSVMDGSAEGYRGVVIGFTLLDTGLRMNELINLKMEDVWLEKGLIKVLGKGPEQMKAKADLRDKIDTICLEFPHYDYRRVTHHLKHEGCQVNHKKVLRLMRESDLLCHVKRKWVKTTDNKHRFPRYPNLIKEMVISRLNQVWLSGITYIRIRTGFVYLAAILDAYFRRVIGYAISTGLDTVRALEALRMAITERQPGPGIIHHSDQGVQ